MLITLNKKGTTWKINKKVYENLSKRQKHKKTTQDLVALSIHANGKKFISSINSKEKLFSTLYNKIILSSNFSISNVCWSIKLTGGSNVMFAVSCYFLLNKILDVLQPWGCGSRHLDLFLRQQICNRHITMFWHWLQKHYKIC